MKLKKHGLIIYIGLLVPLTGHTQSDHFYSEKEETRFVENEYVKKKQLLNDQEVSSKLNFSIYGSYLESKWYNEPSAIRSGFQLGADLKNHWAFSRNLSFFLGMGIAFEKYNFHRDSSQLTVQGFMVKKEMYTYWNTNVLAGFRITSNNQRINSETDRFYIDLGASYHIPLFFQHKMTNDQHQAFTTKRIHEYTDLRAFVNIGFSTVCLYADYKLLGFLKRDYAEPYKLTIGIKINLYTP